MFDEYIHEYIFSGSLPENASTYVTRSADGELYTGLKQGKFCYVLNTRQSGKSSLRVRTMQRLREDGVECAAIDLSAGGIQNVPPEQWYADLIDTLIESFGLDDRVDFGDWWSENQELTLVTRFRKFIERILLAEIKEDIVIFIDEIDSVLSLKFPTDDFFAFIRACYNQRVDNPEYKRLTFCLLGVASPSNLIEDKQRTPFNIGKAISLKGFQLNEVEPLIGGLQGKFSEPKAVMEEILDWTGGQPFLTQKLCQFMVEELEQENPRTVEEVVKSRIIESWESQDEPEHLRTIRSRIFRNEERAGYLLELYQQIRGSEEQDEITDPPYPPLERGVVSSQITADNTIEQSELLLSGLVARREGKLRVYNRIYQEVFNQNWVENELKNLRPYSEAFRAWVASGNQDESRLLRGKALEDAEGWAKDKNLSYQDKQFLAASREKEIQEKIAAEEQAARLERERKDREAAEKRNKVLSEANKKANRRIRNGTVVLAITLLGALSAGTLAWNQVNKANTKHQTIKTEVEAVQKLSKLADELHNQNLIDESYEALRQANLSFRVNDNNLKQAMLLASMAQSYQQLGKLELAKQKFTKSLEYLNKKGNNLSSDQGLQIKVILKANQSKLLSDKDKKEATKAYKKAYDILKHYPNKTDPFKDNQIITAENIESVHRGLLELQPKNQEVWDSLKEHFYTKLVNSLERENWLQADITTDRLILFIADRERVGFLVLSDVQKFSCFELERMNHLWVKNSNGHFGLSVQKKIWINNKLGIKPSTWKSRYTKNYLSFLKDVGWYERGDDNEYDRVAYRDYFKKLKTQEKPKGGLPSLGRAVGVLGKFFFGRCDL